MSAPKVERGMILLYENESPNGALPTRYELLTVASVRQTKKGASVKLVRNADFATIDYSATFPDAEVREPFKVFGLSQNDLGHVWSKT